MYSPQPETAAMLDRAWQIVQSTPYAVTARFVFYQLYTEGWYSGKGSYKDSFLKALSQARHREYKQWRPDTLEDDTREAVIRGQGFDSVEGWLDALTQQLSCSLDLWQSQPYYIELWCEQRGMARQFKHYTSGITIRAMGGQASIPYKYQAARALDEAAQVYGRRPIVLYFGDLDEGGKNIANTLKRDIGKWCKAGFDFVWCGVTQDQVVRYNLPESPDKPGQYQWEALSDTAAAEVIQQTVADFVRPAAMEAVRQEAQQATVWLRGKLAAVADEWQGAGRL
jgi:hypothetical protein